MFKLSVTSIAFVLLLSSFGYAAEKTVVVKKATTDPSCTKKTKTCVIVGEVNGNFSEVATFSLQSKDGQEIFKQVGGNKPICNNEKSTAEATFTIVVNDKNELVKLVDVKCKK